MSNPFRRSSFKDRSSTPTSRPEPDGATAVPLSVNTRVPVPSQKHVEFASPPAIPISPASYPSSPESTRQSPAFRTVLPSTPNYSEAIQVNPYQEAALADEHDVAIEQALQNARTNSEITTSHAVQRDAVKDTLSRFASGPKRAFTSPDISSGQSGPPKPALDVDAFKRLLLTGERTAPVQQSAPSAQATTQLVSDSSSSTASLSQRSILENSSLETPRSSIEQDRGDGDIVRPQVPGARPKPPPPKPRYGKPISETSQNVTEAKASSNAGQVPFIAALQTPTLSTEAAADSDFGFARGLDPSDVKKRPPTPPLTRRKSQNKTAGRPNMSRNTSSRTSVNSSSDEAQSPAPTILGKIAPPPPPMRRINSQASRKASTDLPAMEEEEDTDSASMDRLSTSSKRMPPNPPPLPPPRRARGSSRSSLDSQRPSMAQLGMTSSTRGGEEARRPSSASTESRTGSGAVDILAHLAALQREVDAARGQASG